MASPSTNEISVKGGDTRAGGVLGRARQRQNQPRGNLAQWLTVKLPLEKL